MSQAVLEATDRDRAGVLAHEVCHLRCDRPGLVWWGWVTLAVAAVPVVAAAWWGVTAPTVAGAQVRAVGGFLCSVGLVIAWAPLLAPHARVDRLPSLVRGLRRDLGAVDLTSRQDVIAGLALLDRLEPGATPGSRVGSPSPPETMDRARAVRAYPGGHACDPVVFGARFLLTQAHRPPTGGTRRRVAELADRGSAGAGP